MIEKMQVIFVIFTDFNAAIKLTFLGLFTSVDEFIGDKAQMHLFYSIFTCHIWSFADIEWKGWMGRRRMGCFKDSLAKYGQKRRAPLVKPWFHRDFDENVKLQAILLPKLISKNLQNHCYCPKNLRLYS